MALKPRKAKTDALVAIAQIKKNKIKMVNVDHDKKAKRYTNESQWLDNKEFTTLSQKRMKKGRNETPNFIKSTKKKCKSCLLYTSPSPRDRTRSRMPSSA